MESQSRSSVEASVRPSVRMIHELPPNGAVKTKTGETACCLVAQPSVNSRKFTTVGYVCLLYSYSYVLSVKERKKESISRLSGHQAANAAVLSTYHLFCCFETVENERKDAQAQEAGIHRDLAELNSAAVRMNERGCTIPLRHATTIDFFRSSLKPEKEMD